MRRILLSAAFSFVFICAPRFLFSQQVPIDLFMNSWKTSLPVTTHGTIVERAILTPGNPLAPKKPGACLTVAKSFGRGILKGYAQTELKTLKGEQEILYVLNGSGEIHSSGRQMHIKTGYGVLIPDGKAFTVKNDSPDILELIILVEPFPPDKTPRADILVRNVNTQPVSSGGHWSHIVRNIFQENDGLGVLHSVLIVSLDGMTIGEPHAHVSGTEEVWCQIEGTSTAFLGREIRKQEPGTAYMVPPDGKTTHSNINSKNEPVSFFYYARYGNRP